MKEFKLGYMGRSFIVYAKCRQAADIKLALILYKEDKYMSNYFCAKSGIYDEKGL